MKFHFKLKMSKCFFHLICSTHIYLEAIMWPTFLGLVIWLIFDIYTHQMRLIVGRHYHKASVACNIHSPSFDSKANSTEILSLLMRIWTESFVWAHISFHLVDSQTTTWWFKSVSHIECNIIIVQLLIPTAATSWTDSMKWFAL